MSFLCHFRVSRAFHFWQFSWGVFWEFLGNLLISAKLISDNRVSFVSFLCHFSGILVSVGAAAGNADPAGPALKINSGGYDLVKTYKDDIRRKMKDLFDLIH